MSLQNIPRYTDNRSIVRTFQDIITRPNRNSINYEHHVSTWVRTMLKTVFHSKKFSLKAKVIDVNAEKKPDYLIRELYENVNPIPLIYVELKKVKG